jgi:hypothetical protein
MSSNCVGQKGLSQGTLALGQLGSWAVGQLGSRNKRYGSVVFDTCFA